MYSSESPHFRWIISLAGEDRSTHFLVSAGKWCLLLVLLFVLNTLFHNHCVKRHPLPLQQLRECLKSSSFCFIMQKLCVPALLHHSYSPQWLSVGNLQMYKNVQNTFWRKKRMGGEERERKKKEKRKSDSSKVTPSSLTAVHILKEVMGE